MNGGPSGFGNSPVTKSFLVLSGILSVLSGIQGRAHHLGLSYKKIFDHMHERNEVSWGALMAGYLHMGSNLEVVELLKSMRSEEHIHPNEYILATVVSACANEGRIGEGSQFHGYVAKSGLEFYQYVKNALINLYFSCHNVRGGMRVWNTLPGHDVFSYNLVLNGLLENGYVMESLGVLSRMAGECITFDAATYSTAFGLCSSIKDLKLSRSVHCRMLRSCIDCDVFVGSSLIDMYGKCGDSRKAREIFDKLPRSNLVLWTAVMAAYFQSGCFEEALNLLPKMQLQDILPNDYTFTVLLNSCAVLSALSYGNCLHGLIHKVGFEGHTIVGNALMNMYYKSSDIKAANKVFTHLVHRDSVSWNIIICGYSQHGLGGLALCMFQGMVAAGELPNYVTFIGVLCACGHLGLVQEGFDYLNNVMKYYDIQPGVEHYTCVIGLLGKAGLLNEADRLMRSAPVQWDVIAWRTLLSACIVHRKYGFGQRIAEIVLGMYPNDVGTYTLLSNLYAKARRWDGVVTIRKLLRERSIKKEPGASWIEVKAKTHVFISGDHSHPEYMQIFEKIGSNKYSVFILFSILFSFLGQVLVLGLLKDDSLKLNSGPYGLIFSSFVPIYLDIPISTRIWVLSLQFSDKSFIYLAGLQLLLSSWRRSVIPGICGLLAGSLYRLNVLYIRKAKEHKCRAARIICCYAGLYGI
ncbi:hypothetical protein MLD38_007620 [Melastoma candidum]|uniref:Uncharacterized protein n=1 Tax=Melastoma candidum TaxID=119954 RepID=A0ACB9RVG0_9MYRT|nr:hypothetical protein MLD38_007620 [Melastoma candidum]